MNRYEQLNMVQHFEGMPGFVEALLHYESVRGEDFGLSFSFSRNDYDIEGTPTWLGKINDNYFIGSPDLEGKDVIYRFYEDKKILQMELAKELMEWDMEKKGFWMNEVERL